MLEAPECAPQEEPVLHQLDREKGTTDIRGIMDIGVKVLIGLMLPPLAALLYVTFLIAVYEIGKVIKKKNNGHRS